MRLGAALAFSAWLLGCGVSNGVVSRPPPDAKSTGPGKALLDATGPDIGVDPGQLQSSVRVVTNASVSQAEVDEHCAGATFGRTLVRFDVKTPNYGPGQLHVGAVSCKSTNPSPSCQNVDCYQNPSCCCDGQQTCTATGGSVGGQYFQYSCAHGHIHYQSFANYRLLGRDGTVAATGHKQSFCLMDIDGAQPGQACTSAERYGCGDQGIHAGCADVYSAGLPCAFVDVTGVPAGDYTLEVTMDPLDAIDESNESNNVATAQVHLDGDGVDAGAPPPDAGTPLFLVRKGVGSAAGANAYYASNVPGFQPGALTLDGWKAEHLGGAPVASALYRNRNELGFWREMTCTRTIARGVGGCTVTNWGNVDDAQNGLPNKGTVAMDVSAEGYTRFYVFLPDGHLSPSAVLDSEGPKFVPNLCTVCHGGEYAGNGAPDLGSIWREFEPSLLQAQPGLAPAQAEQQWFDLNQCIRQANAAVRGEAEGAPFGTDHAKAAQEQYVAQMYPDGGAPAVAVGDAAHVPASWQGGPTPQVASAKAQLWHDFVAPYCMSCHRTSSSVDYSNYARFEEVSANLGNGNSLLQRYIHVDPNDPQRHQLPFMPQSQLAFENLNNDATALIAVETWLQVANQRPPAAAIAGDAARTVTAGDAVSLDASGSSSPDGLPLTFRWEVLSGPSLTFDGGGMGAVSGFVAPQVLSPTPLTVRVRVTDPNGAEGDALVTFTVQPPPPTIVDFHSVGAPLAIPDNDPTGVVSTLAVSDGRQVVGLEVQVDITHTYIGDLVVTLLGPNGFTKVLSDRAGRNAHDIHQLFAVPEATGMSASGDWRLSVTDTAAVDVGTLDSWSLSFAVLGTTHTPSARIAALASTVVQAGDGVSLDGSGSSSPDGLPLTYAWDVTTGTALAFSPSAAAAVVSFTAPEVAQQTSFVVRLRVSDPNGASSDALAALTVKPRVTAQTVVAATGLPLAIPDANATGVASSVTVADNLAIASLSAKVDVTHTYVGDLTLKLQGPNGFEKVLRNHQGGNAHDLHESYAVPEAAGMSTAGTWRLVVIDGYAQDVGTLDAFELTFGTNGASQAPTASITASALTVQSGETVQLSGSAASPAGLSLLWLWDVTAGPPVTFSPLDNIPQVSFVAPNVLVDTEVVVRLRVTDSAMRTGEATVHVLVKPSMSLPVVEVAAADVPLAIPDNDPNGVTSTLQVSQMQTLASLSVTVDITHTYIGDLTVTLVGPGGFSKVLHNRAGAGTDNLHQTYAVPEAVGHAAGGAWQLKVVDGAAVDVGTLDGWKLTFQ